MARGFFASSQLQIMKRPLRDSPQCAKCGLYQSCKSPKMPVDGEGKKKILIVGEAPGATEDEQGKPFVGTTGQLLKDTLTRIGVDVRRDCWLTNTLRCRPPKNATPTLKQVDYCRPYLIGAIKELQPEVTLLLGASAVRSLIGHLWKEDPGPIGRWVGWQIPDQQFNTWICPTWHPSFLHRSEEGRTNQDVAKLLWERHLTAAVKIKGRPWMRVIPPDTYVTCILDPSEAAHRLCSFIKEGKPVAFDFESDRLKPDHPDASIITCAVSTDVETISYPWVGEAIKATEALLLSDIPKIGWNIKHEDRWCCKVFRKPVKKWLWDGMLAAHVLDNRKGICSLKFQAFTTLGVPPYADHITPYMHTNSGNYKNALTDRSKIALKDLLKYNGLDALLTYQIGIRQMERMGFKL